MDSTCVIILGSFFGGGCLFAACCYHFVCRDDPIPNRVTPIHSIIYKPRYGDSVNRPPDYEEIAEPAIADQPLPILPPPEYEETIEII
jgi:hypothetical protein